MKFDNNKQINSQESYRQILTSSQETNNSYYKTTSKKSISKNKGSATGSTHCPGSSYDKKCYKQFNPGKTAQKINFDEYNSTQEFSNKSLDQYQYSSIQSQSQRQNTQSQNIGYCHSQLEDDFNYLSSNNPQDELNSNGYENRQNNFNNMQNNQNEIFQQANTNINMIHQQNSSIRNQQNYMKPMQEQQQYANKLSSREMIAENPYPQVNQAESTSNIHLYQNSMNINQNNIMNDENEIQSSQPKQYNLINQSERTLLGDITEIHRPLAHSSFEVEEQHDDQQEQQYNQQELQNNTSNRYQYNNLQEYIKNNRKEKQCNNKHDQQVHQYNNQKENQLNNKENQYNKYNIFNIQQEQQNENKPVDRQNDTNEQPYINQRVVSNTQNNDQQEMINQNQYMDDDNYEKVSLFNPVDHDNFINREENEYISKEEKDIMMQKSMIYYIDAESLLNYRSNFTNFPKKRIVLIDWMQEVSSGLYFKRETYQQSISIVDRYFQKVPNVSKNRIQLVGGTALLIAHKLEVNLY